MSHGMRADGVAGREPFAHLRFTHQPRSGIVPIVGSSDAVRDEKLRRLEAVSAQWFERGEGTGITIVESQPDISGFKTGPLHFCELSREDARGQRQATLSGEERSMPQPM